MLYLKIKFIFIYNNLVFPFNDNAKLEVCFSG